MYYVYVIKSLKYNTRYIGSSQNIEKRIDDHNTGKCRYTSGRMPWKLVYEEKYVTHGEAMKRKKFLKSWQGRKLLDKTLGD